MIESLNLMAYIIVVVCHYIGTAYVVVYVGCELLKIESYFKILCMYVPLWLLSGYVFNGCIFTYIEDYFLVHAGLKTKMTYSFTDSLAYQLFFQYFEGRDMIPVLMELLALMIAVYALYAIVAGFGKSNRLAYKVFSLIMHKVKNLGVWVVEKVCEIIAFFVKWLWRKAAKK